jgi:hypothetical protein
MPVLSPQALLALPAAIAAYRQAEQGLSAEEGAALDRLAAAQEAAQFFAFLPLADDEGGFSADAKGRIFVADCVTAFRFDKGEHRAQIEKLKAASAAHEEAQAHLDKLRAYFGVVEPSGADFDVVETPAPAEPSRSLQEKLDRRAYRPLRSLQRELDDDRRAIEEVRRSISRKGDATAARSRAIGWLKESVKRLCAEKPLSKRLQSRSVAAFADALFATRTRIDPQAVKDATTPSEWRLDRRFPRSREADR